ncbi:MAG: tetratricopeptide repeat protein [Gemmatimonadota bacterium]|jgi:tetratricopeptide (TPR) repeat protein
MAGTPAYQRLFAELKRRQVFKVAAVYGAVAFVVLQVADIMVPALVLPEALTRAIALILILGFPIALVMAWAFELTPEGMKRTEDPTEAEIEAIVAQPRSRRWPSGVLALAGISALVVGAFFVLRPEVTFRGPRVVEAGEALPAIAVLPFSVSGPEAEFWREGMANTLATNLNGLAGLRTVSSRTVLARWDRAVGDGEATDLETALSVARQSGAAYAVLGDLVVAGNRTQVSADVYDAETGRQLGQARSAGSVEGDSAFALIDRFTVEIARVAPTPEEAVVSAVQLARLTTASVEALKAYLEGESHYRRSDFVAAIEAYQRAVDTDSTFAMAHYRLSKSYGWERGDGTEGGHAETALRLADRLPERERTLVEANVAFLDGRVHDVIRTMEEAVRRHPDDVEAWFLLGDTYYHIGDQALVDRLAESERAFGRALALDPSLGPTHIHLIANAFELGDSSLVRQRLDDYRRYSGESPTMRANELAFDLAFGDPPTRDAALAALDTISFQDRNAFATVPASLLHPTMLELRAEVTQRRLATGIGDDNLEFLAAIGLAETAVDRGRWDDFQAASADPRMNQAREFETYRAWLAGLAVPDSIVEQELTLTPADTLSDGRNLAGVFLAAELGRAAEVESNVDRWRALAAIDLEEGNEEFAETGIWLADMVEARLQWSTGDPEGALARLEPLQREATGWQFLTPLNEIQRMWLADLNLELGRRSEAETYYRSLTPWARAVLALARLRDEAGDLDEAAQYYAWFIEMWKDADPELQPQVQEARDRLQEIVRERG